MASGIAGRRGLGFGIRDSGFGIRDSGIGNRESLEHTWRAARDRPQPLTPRRSAPGRDGVFPVMPLAPGCAPTCCGHRARLARPFARRAACARPGR
ncbi:hypothetical protein EJL05_14395 [Xanthomonas arboricola pv. pruni]|nr:hypothetical protein EJL05_14395 [Xanthomonas arboricola pv. pruni]